MIIQVDVSAGTAVLRKECVLTVGMVGAQATFNFGSHWQGLSRTAVFRQGDVTRDVVGITDRCAIPPEVLAQPGLPVEIGVYGFDADGKLVIPTVWVKTAPVHPGANPSGDESTDTTLPVWQQILGMIGNMDEVPKDTLAASIRILDETQEELLQETAGLWDEVHRMEEGVPNPHKLTFTGAVEAVYDGSEAVTVPIPSGIGKDVLLLADRQTGRVYRLFAENGQLKMTAGDGIGGMDCVTLTDRQTGRVYELYVHDGELKMTE